MKESVKVIVTGTSVNEMSEPSLMEEFISEIHGKQDAD